MYILTIEKKRDDKSGTSKDVSETYLCLKVVSLNSTAVGASG